MSGTEAVPAWVQMVFAQFALAYGNHKFSLFFRDQPTEVLHAYWAHELAGLNEGDIAYGLRHLPPNEIPNVMQFRAACLRRPPEAFRALPEPVVSPADRARVVARLKALAGDLTTQRNPKAWAWALRAREEDGEKLTQFQRRCWREALERELRVEAEKGDYAP